MERMKEAKDEQGRAERRKGSAGGAGDGFLCVWVCGMWYVLANVRAGTRVPDTRRRRALLTWRMPFCTEAGRPTGGAT